MSINLPLLDLAVEKTIRPWLITQDKLNDKKVEGYHHQKIIPKVKPLLTREALESDPKGSLETALKSSVNLLSQFEQMNATEFLSTQEPETIREHALDLLYGEDPLEKRLNRFHNWAKVEETATGIKSGINLTAVGYLLAMKDPTQNAFCKPEVYKAAMEALLPGSAKLSRLERVLHATHFYRDALGLFQRRYHLPFADLQHVHIAFYVMHKPPPGFPGWGDLLTSEVTPVNSPASSPEPMHNDLNVILYGPPGTGKTYDTLQRAVAICDGKVPEDRSMLVKRFDALRKEKRIFFVTFHQAYGYEDFIEGLRPVLQDNEPLPHVDKANNVQYECRPGIFKQLCELAKIDPSVRAKDINVDWENATVWKMSLGDTNDPEDASIYDDCLQDNNIRLGYGDDTNVEGCETREAILKALRAKTPDMLASDYTLRAVNALKLGMQDGDLVIISDGNYQFRAIARISGPYQYLSSEEKYRQARPVQWLAHFKESLPREVIYNKIFSQMTIYRLRNEELNREALRELVSPISGAHRNYVLIIDEINRGNIAKILGELITLLEPDKRLGAKNELQVTLPYSGKPFGVPNNVHVIGTMNTADRSIAFLDVALRRRFKFIEMMPDLEVLRSHLDQQGIVDGVDVPGLLQAINDRIELLYDRDHQIGHSFFLGVKSLLELRDVFCSTVVPLLQEYFYGDWAKVCLVLGSPISQGSMNSEASSKALIVSDTLKSANLLGKEAETAEDKQRYRVNPAFLNADSAEVLRPMFAGVMAVTA